MIEQAFTIKIPNEPFTADFSNGNTHAGTYKGLRFLKIQVENSTGIVKNVMASADTMDDINEASPVPMPEHTIYIIDARDHPFEAAFLTHNYETGEVAVYTEDLGTTDEDGNAETWTHYWNDNNGVLNQIWMANTLKYNSDTNTFTDPDVMLHGGNEDDFWQSVANHIQGATDELARGLDVYSQEELDAISDYKTWISGVEAKYKGTVAFYKIPFKNVPEYK